jgi:hypothetical protein
LLVVAEEIEKLHLRRKGQMPSLIIPSWMPVCNGEEIVSASLFRASTELRNQVNRYTVISTMLPTPYLLAGHRKHLSNDIEIGNSDIFQ